MIDFAKYLNPGAPEAIISSRIEQLASEGYQYSLNIEYINDQLKTEQDQEVRASLLNQREEFMARASGLLDTIKWHERILNGTVDTQKEE
jgi:hypothetical protein